MVEYTSIVDFISMTAIKNYQASNGYSQAKIQNITVSIRGEQKKKTYRLSKSLFHKESCLPMFCFSFQIEIIMDSKLRTL